MLTSRASNLKPQVRDSAAEERAPLPFPFRCAVPVASSGNPRTGPDETEDDLPRLPPLNEGGAASRRRLHVIEGLVRRRACHEELMPIRARRPRQKRE